MLRPLATGAASRWRRCYILLAPSLQRLTAGATRGRRQAALLPPLGALVLHGAGGTAVKVDRH
jgi:hypothetical protein